MWIQVSLCNFSNIQMLYSAGPQNEIKQRLNHPMRGYKSWWCRTFQIHFENARYELGFADCMRKIVSSSCEVSPQADPLAIYMPRSLVFLLVAHFEISPPLMHGKLIRLSVNIFLIFLGDNGVHFTLFVSYLRSQIVAGKGSRVAPDSRLHVSRVEGVVKLVWVIRIDYTKH